MQAKQVCKGSHPTVEVASGNGHCNLHGRQGCVTVRLRIGKVLQRNAGAIGGADFHAQVERHPERCDTATTEASPFHVICRRWCGIEYHCQAAIRSDTVDCHKDRGRDADRHDGVLFADEVRNREGEGYRPTGQCYGGGLLGIDTDYYRGRARLGGGAEFGAPIGETYGAVRRDDHRFEAALTEVCRDSQARCHEGREWRQDEWFRDDHVVGDERCRKVWERWTDHRRRGDCQDSRHDNHRLHGRRWPTTSATTTVTVAWRWRWDRCQDEDFTRGQDKGSEGRGRDCELAGRGIRRGRRGIGQRRVGAGDGVEARGTDVAGLGNCLARRCGRWRPVPGKGCTWVGDQDRRVDSKRTDWLP